MNLENYYKSMGNGRIDKSPSLSLIGGLMVISKVAFLTIVIVALLSAQEREEMKTYYDDGQPATMYFKKLDSSGNYVKDGPYVHWYSNGQVMEKVMYKDDKPEGTITSWYENGQKKMQCSMKNGKCEGLLIKWHANGMKLYQAVCKNGLANGKCTVWYDNGKKSLEVIEVDNVENGPYTEWNENGEKTDEGIFVNGEKTRPQNIVKDTVTSDTMSH